MQPLAGVWEALGGRGDWRRAIWASWRANDTVLYRASNQRRAARYCTMRESPLQGGGQIVAGLGLDWIGLDWIGLDWIGLDDGLVHMQDGR